MKEYKEPIPARAAAYCALYPMLQQIAKDHGYALAVHGSIHRDMDLIAVPWIEEASDALTLIKAMKDAMNAVTHNETMDHLAPELDPREKPHGRLAYALHVTNKGMWGGYFDISVMPKITQTTHKG